MVNCVSFDLLFLGLRSEQDYLCHCHVNEASQTESAAAAPESAAAHKQCSYIYNSINHVPLHSAGATPLHLKHSIKAGRSAITMVARLAHLDRTMYRGPHTDPWSGMNRLHPHHPCQQLPVQDWRREVRSTPQWRLPGGHRTTPQLCAESTRSPDQTEAMYKVACLFDKFPARHSNKLMQTRPMHAADFNPLATNGQEKLIRKRSRMQRKAAKQESDQFRSCSRLRQSGYIYTIYVYTYTLSYASIFLIYIYTHACKHLYKHACIQ